MASEGGASPNNEHKPDDAWRRFNADWASLAFLDVSRVFSDEYNQMLLLALHESDASTPKSWSCLMIMPRSSRNLTRLCTA